MRSFFAVADQNSSVFHTFFVTERSPFCRGPQTSNGKGVSKSLTSEQLVPRLQGMVILIFANGTIHFRRAIVMMVIEL
jgi:hypothetical protein